MTDDQTRLSRLNRLIKEMESTIAEARETSSRMKRMMRDAGIEDEQHLKAMLRSDRCSPAMRALVDQDIADLHRELKEEERVQMIQAGYQESRKPHQRRRMLRI